MKTPQTITSSSAWFLGMTPDATLSARTITARQREAKSKRRTRGNRRRKMLDSHLKQRIHPCYGRLFRSSPRNAVNCTRKDTIGWAELMEGQDTSEAGSAPIKSSGRD